MNENKNIAKLQEETELPNNTEEVIGAEVNVKQEKIIEKIDKKFESIVTTFSIKNVVNSDNIWKTLGNAFDNLSQAIEELIDDAHSSFEVAQSIIRHIIVSCEVLEDGRVKFSVEDTGSGILKEILPNVFSVGDTSYSHGPLNEHGTGLKHGLAYADKANSTWFVATRTAEDLENGTYTRISHPFKFGLTGEVRDGSWPGCLDGTGTYIEFICPKEIFDTIAADNRIKDPKKIADCLYEELGYRYAYLIENHKLQITFKYKDYKEEISEIVGEVIPNWATTAKDRDTKKELEGMVYLNLSTGKTYQKPTKGCIKIEYKFGTMKKPCGKRVAFSNKCNLRHFVPSMACSGVHISYNGKYMESGLITPIWSVSHHPSYNRFLGIVAITSFDNAIPTRTAKTGFVQGSKELATLYAWIAKVMPDIKIKPENECIIETETEAFDRISKSRAKAGILSSTEMHCFTAVGGEDGADLARIDMYEVHPDNSVHIFEGKKKPQTTIKDVYQLVMYWDGLVYDGITPDNATLVCDYHPDSVKNLIDIVNTMKDQNNNFYNLNVATWDEIDPAA